MGMLLMQISPIASEIAINAIFFAALMLAMCIRIEFCGDRIWLVLGLRFQSSFCFFLVLWRKNAIRNRDYFNSFP